jgi:hypothetical protein
LADATIERLIEAEFEAGAANYSHWVPKTGGSGEETHVAMLFEKLAAIFKNINDQVSLLASQRKQNEHLEFELSYRIVGKFEEGNPYLAAKKFSTDICLFLRRMTWGISHSRAALRSFKQSASMAGMWLASLVLIPLTFHSSRILFYKRHQAIYCFWVRVQWHPCP